jgi:hypothetical protein
VAGHLASGCPVLVPEHRRPQAQSDAHADDTGLRV